MKTLIIIAALLAANSIIAQSGPGDQEFKKTTPNLATKAEELRPTLKPNEVAGEQPDITYSGVVVQVKKTDNPLQLINPFAPASYGSGKQNFSRDITPRGEGGLNLFSINY